MEVIDFVIEHFFNLLQFFLNFVQPMLAVQICVHSLYDFLAQCLKSFEQVIDIGLSFEESRVSIYMHFVMMLIGYFAFGAQFTKVGALGCRTYRYCWFLVLLARDRFDG